DFYDLDYLAEGEFDSIMANAAFVHLLERADMSVMLQSIYRKLRPGGLCFIRNLYREQNGQPVEQEYFSSKERFHDLRWFVYYSRMHLAKLAKNVGFQIDDNATRKIAKERGFGNLEVILKKGFPHEKFDGVY